MRVPTSIGEFPAARRDGTHDASRPTDPTDRTDPAPGGRPVPSPFVQRFRTAVAMWIFVGLAGAPFTAIFAIMLLTATGPFQDMAEFSVDAEFAPGEEVRTNAVRPGGLMVLAFPATADVDTVECTAKSRVYSTGTQHVETVRAESIDGVAEVLRSDESSPRSFVPISVVDWMGTDFLSCSGDGVESFAITSTRGVHGDGFRYGTGAVLLVFSPVLLGLGLLALHFTRKWSRQASQQQYPYWPHQAQQYPPQQYPQQQYPHPQYPHPQYPPLPPGHNPYEPPAGTGR